jgi:hypothetical protein
MELWMEHWLEHWLEHWTKHGMKHIRSKYEALFDRKTVHDVWKLILIVSGIIT